MNARAEAVARLDGRYDARVLEPSPPAVAEAPWFADDPVGREDPPSGLPRVSPVAGGDLRWEDLLAKDPGLASWCSDRWLAAQRELPAPPSELVATRLALHRLAEQVISPARERANGKIGLRFTRGGFGTPFFGEDVQLRVEAKNLVVQSRDGERAAQITTLTDMATHVGPELLEHAPVDDEPLDVDGHAARFIGDWFGFGAWVLEELRARVGDDVDPSRVQIWPEHFDIAVEIGVESAGARATYGASPGDEEHPEPYLYVAPWGEIPDGELFGATAFKGAELPCRDLLAAGDFAAQSDLARRFFEERMAALAGAR